MHIFLPNYFLLAPSVWTGGHQISNDVFYWNGTTFKIPMNGDSDFSNWGQYEPNSTLERCLALVRRWNFKWNDAQCTDKNVFICERKII